jgi:ATP-dependent RNA helicase DDX18/HAS1
MTNDRILVKKAYRLESETMVEDLSSDAPLVRSFSDLPIHPSLKQNLVRLGFSEMFPIQVRGISPMLDGLDILAAAKTGSGKTLAFLIPAVNLLLNLKAAPEQGILVLVIAPTRELAVQTSDVATELLASTGIRSGLAIGGTSKTRDSRSFSQGLNLLVATPGRLVDHIIGTPSFTLRNVKLLVIDEADRILESGFHTQLNEIIANLPETRQTALFSATQTHDVKSLAAVSFKHGDPLYIGVDDDSSSSTASGLTQAFVIAPPDQRLMLLITFLRRNRKKKVMVFFSTKSSVKFHGQLFAELSIKSLAIHGDQSQQNRIEAFRQFKERKYGVMLCTDVAARGLDIPAVEWIVQYDPPSSEKEYIHRVGRSARAGAEGRALLFLMKNERKFLEYLEGAKVPLKEFTFPTDKVMQLELLISNILSTKRDLQKLAKEAFRAYLMSYDSHPLNDCFNVAKLDIESLAKSFGFEEVPHLDIQVSTGKKDDGAWIQKAKRKTQRP